MGRKSSVTQLDPRVQQAVDEAVRDGRATIDDIVELIRSMGGEASRSSVARHVKNAREQAKFYREAMEVQRFWVGELKADPNGDIGRLLSEMLRTVAYQKLGEMGQAEGKVKAGDVMFLAKALKDVAAADKTSVERIAKIRQQERERAAADAAEAAKTVARKGGISDDVIRKIEEGVLGIVR